MSQVTCKDTTVVVGGDETMLPVSVEELATCAAWSSQVLCHGSRSEG